MTADELKQTLSFWQLNAAQAAKVLCVHTNKMSEYLDGITRIPCSMALHIDALNHIDASTRQTMFQQRLNRQPHEQMAVRTEPYHQ